LAHIKGRDREGRLANHDGGRNDQETIRATDDQKTVASAADDQKQARRQAEFKPDVKVSSELARCREIAHGRIPLSTGSVSASSICHSTICCLFGFHGSFETISDQRF
jgi:hypothetical protein